MGQKDIVEKVLEDYPDVFADIINVLLFQGKQIVKEEELWQTRTKSQYKADDSELHEQERDNLKLWVRGKKAVLLGLENQTTIDYDMPLRIIGYDGASYREQLVNSSDRDRREVITIVLYFGDTPWRGHRSLQDRVSRMEGVAGNDYRIHVFEIAFLTDEQVRMFRSDFGIIADYFVKKRRGEIYEGNQKPIRHVDAMLKFMAVFAKDQRFLKIKLDKKEEVNMCVILDRVEERGRQDGIRIGREEERAKRDRILDQVEERGRQDGIRIGREEERAKRDRILDQVEERGRQDGIRIGREEERAKRDQILDQVEERGRQDGIRIGREEEKAKRDQILDQAEERGREDGINCMNRLIGILIHQGKMDDVERVCEDEHLREEFLVRYHIK